jgi:hypothetical protein
LLLLLWSDKPGLVLDIKFFPNIRGVFFYPDLMETGKKSLPDLSSSTSVLFYVTLNNNP